MRTALSLLTLFALTLSPTASAQGVPVDLSTWSQRGPSGNGSWTLSGDNSSVLQTTNGEATFYVSPNDFFNTTVTGTFGVETTGDDDYIGFVFGYQTPASTGTDYDFLLFSWKQFNQNGDLAGFTLSDVNCSNCLSFGNYNEDRDAAGYNLIAQNTGTGWADNTVYTFDLLYTADSIRVDITGGTGAFQSGQTVFAVDAADAGLAGFPSGRFGFFNHSQSSVRYSGFVQNNPPVAVDDDVTATEGMARTFNVLANDSDPDSDALTIDSFTMPSGGTLAQDGDSSFTYTPSLGTVSDSFVYTITDGELTGTATVNVTVEPVVSGGVTLTVTNVLDPVMAGERVSLDVSVLNESSENVVQIVADVTDPNGRGLRQKLNLYAGTVAPGGSYSNTRSKRIPAGSPLGTYTADIQALSGSGEVLASQTIQFEVIGGAGLRVTEALSAFPNPASGTLTLRFGLAGEATARLAVYDALGREVAVALDGPVSAGPVEAALDAATLPAGLYVARLVMDGHTETLRFSVVR